MKKLFVLMMPFFLVALSFSTATANENDQTEISGNYSGTLESKAFIVSSDATKATSDKSYGIDLMFNGNVFIYQVLTAKAMGTYQIVGDHIEFIVTSTKGNQALVDKIFSHNYKFSKSGKQLMLISENNESSDVFIYRLTRGKS